MQKILVIDDDTIFREHVQVALRKNGYTTMAAENGASGLHLVWTASPDLILSDVNMEQDNGYAVWTLCAPTLAVCYATFRSRSTR